MKTRKLLTTILLIVFVLSACKKTTDELTSMIPAEATHVVYIDTKSLIDKSNYDLLKNEATKKALDDVKQLLGDNGDAQKLLTEFVERDINVLGVDLKGDMFVFVAEDITGVVLKVNDASRIGKVLTSAFHLTKDEIDVKDGINTISINNYACAAWDNNRMLILVPQSNYYWRESSQDIKPIDIAVSLLKQKSEKSINNGPGFAQFMANRKDISVYASLNNEISREASGMFRGKPEILEHANQVKNFTNISFEKGEIIATSEVYFANDTVKTKFESLVNQIVKPIKGDIMKFVPENPLLMMCTGLNGDGINKLIQESGMFQSREKDELETILPAFNGDILYYIDDMVIAKTTVYGYEHEGLKLRMGVLAETTQGKELLNKFMELDSRSEFNQISENMYQMENEINDTICLGYKDNYFLFSYNNSPFAEVEGKSNMGNSAKGKLFYLKGNNKGLFNIVGEMRSLNRRGRTIAKNAVELLQSCEVSVDEKFNAQGRLEFRDKDKNSMETICLYLDNLINSEGDLFSFY